MNGKSPRNSGRDRSLAESYQKNTVKDFLTSKSGLIAIGIILFSVFLSVFLLGVMMSPDASPNDTTTNTNPEEPDTAIVSDVNYSSVYENTTPSVVSVYANGDNGRTSQGSGFVYDDQNHIVTNWHVINNGDNFYVRYSNGEWASAEVIGSDPYTDLSVLKVESRPDSAKPLPISNKSPRVGQKVLALGTPDNLRGSLSAGTVSGKNRSMTTPQSFVIPDMIQTDASLNPGNSGGPLVGMDGTVIGVNRARQGENLGFAISGRIINTVVPSLIDDGKHQHSLVGISGTTMTPTIAEANDMPLRSGILITEVVENGPSKGVLKGGSGEKIQYNRFEILDGGDLITEVNGKTIATNEDLTSYLMRKTQPGDTVTFSIIRNGTQKTVNVTLGERSSYGGTSK